MGITYHISCWIAGSHVKIESFFLVAYVWFLFFQYEKWSWNFKIQGSKLPLWTHRKKKPSQQLQTEYRRLYTSTVPNRFQRTRFRAPPESRSLSDLLWKRRAKRRHETRCYLHSANVIYFHLTSWKVLLSLDWIIEKNLQSAFGLIPPGVGIMKIPIIPESVLNWQHGKKSHLLCLDVYCGVFCRNFIQSNNPNKQVYN